MPLRLCKVARCASSGSVGPWPACPVTGMARASAGHPSAPASSTKKLLNEQNKLLALLHFFSDLRLPAVGLTAFCWTVFGGPLRMPRPGLCKGTSGGKLVCGIHAAETSLGLARLPGAHHLALRALGALLAFSAFAGALLESSWPLAFRAPVFRAARALLACRSSPLIPGHTNANSQGPYKKAKLPQLK